MKRDPALHTLSHEHHAALFVAQRLRRAGDAEAAEARDAFLAFWREDGRRHFRVEEEVLLPALAEHGDVSDQRVVRMLLDHAELRARAARLERGLDGTPDDLHGLGEALARHVRLEEREVFPLVEAALPPEAVAALAAELEAAGA